MPDSSAFEKIIDALRAHGDNVTENGDKARAHCPAHNGTSDDSLAIKSRDDGYGIVVYCHAGCETPSVMAAVGLTMSDLFDDDDLQNIWRPRAKYTYSGGREVYRNVDAKGKKTFRQSGNTKTDRTLFHGDQIGTRQVVYVVEGEKDVLSVEAVGQAAVSAPMGAGKAHIADWSPLTDKLVIIIADNDDPGINHAEDIRDILTGIARTVTVVRPTRGKDISDHIAAGGKISECITDPGFEGTVPIPLTGVLSFVPFPTPSFPAPIADMIAAVAEQTQTDEAMAGMAAISALSASAGGRIEVEIRDGWIEPLCTYSVCVADSGERKSAVQRPMLQPVLDAEAELVKAAMPFHVEARAKKDVAEKWAVMAVNIAAKADRSDYAKFLLAQQEAIDARQAAEDIDVPPLPRLVADDVTPEAAASLLAECGGSIAVVSAEGGVFDIISGRYSGGIPNMDVWLKAHSGDMIRVDRKGRAPEYIPKPAMTLGLMIQPEVLKTIAAQPGMRGRGLIARFLYAMPVSYVGSRNTDSVPVPETVLKEYGTVIHSLAKELPCGGVLKLTPEAQAAISTIAAETELALREDGPLGSLRDWGGKYVAAVARIAGLLHLAKHSASANHGLKTKIDDTTVWAAADLGTYYKFCAIRAFEVMATDATVGDAIYLLGKLKVHPEDTISEREMQRTARKFQKKADLLAAVEVLVDHGWLQPKAAAQQKGQGRPASPQYKIHPLTKV